MDSAEQGQLLLLLAGLYMFGLGLLAVLLASLVSLLPLPPIIVATVVVIVVNIWAWREELRKSVLYVHSILNLLGGAFVGVIVASWLSGLSGLITFLVSFSAMDLISFTKFGKWTLNRKLMGNGPLLKRLSVSLPYPGFPDLYPIIGVGDIFCFALIAGGALQIWRASFLWIAIVAVGVGQVLNVALVVLFRNRSWYRGLPATVFPVLIFVLVALLQNG